MLQAKDSAVREATSTDSGESGSSSRRKSKDRGASRDRLSRRKGSGVAPGSPSQAAGAAAAAPGSPSSGGEKRKGSRKKKDRDSSEVASVDGLPVGIGPPSRRPSTRQKAAASASATPAATAAKDGSGALPVGMKPPSVGSRTERSKKKSGVSIQLPGEQGLRIARDAADESPIDALRLQLQQERATAPELDQSIKEAYKQSPSDPSRKFTYAFSLSRSKSRRKRKKSIKLFHELLEQAKLSPSHTAARDIDFYLAKTYYWNEDFKDCLECLNRILATEPNNNQIRTFRALLFEDRLCVEGGSSTSRSDHAFGARLTRSGNAVLSTIDRLDITAAAAAASTSLSSTISPTSSSSSTASAVSTAGSPTVLPIIVDGHGHGHGHGHGDNDGQSPSPRGMSPSRGGAKVARIGSGGDGSTTARRMAALSGRRSGQSTFAEAMQDDTELQALRRGFLLNVRFSDVLQELNPRFDLAANPARRLLSQWQSFPSEQEVTHEWQQATLQQMPPAKMYLFSDCLLYATYNPHAAKVYELQRMFPLYRLRCELRELPSRIWQLTLACDAADRPLVTFTQGAGVQQLPEAVQREQQPPDDDGQQQQQQQQLEMVRVSIAESAALLPLGLSRTHKAIAVTRQTTADQMRKALIQKMCTALKVHHVQIIATECEDYRLWRVLPDTDDEVVFESSDCPLRFLSIDPAWALVLKPYPPRKSKHVASTVVIDKRLDEEHSSTKAELSDEEHSGVIRIYFSDTPLLLRLEYNASTFKTLFISSSITTGEVCKILISKLTDNLVSSTERKNIRAQLEQYRLWGLSSDNRRMYLDVASHPWPIFKKACLQDPHFRFVFSPTTVSASSPAAPHAGGSGSSLSFAPVDGDTSGSGGKGKGRALPWVQRMLGSRHAGKDKSASAVWQQQGPMGLRQHLRVDEELTWSGEDPTTSFQIERQIGAGAYGCVFLATHTATGKALAIKEFFCSTKSAAELSVIESEIAILKQCRHPDIVGYYGSCRKNETDLWVFMDYCEHGSLQQLFKLLPGGCLSEHQSVAVLLPVLRGLEYLHSQGVVHRDIKSGNILINAQGEAKIADFGISKKVTTESDNSVQGTPQFMSPEAVDGTATTTATDIWSLGITLIEMLEGAPPNADIPPVRAMYLTLYSEPPQFKNLPSRSPEVVSFVAACLQKEPTKRPTATDLLSHPLVDPRSAIVELLSRLKDNKLDSSSASSLSSAVAASSPTPAALSAPSSPSTSTSPPSSSSSSPSTSQIQDASSLASLFATPAVGASLQDMENTIDQMLSRAPRDVDEPPPTDFASPTHLSAGELWRTPEMVLPSNLLELEEIVETSNCLPVEEEVHSSDAGHAAEPVALFSPLDQPEPIEVISSPASLYLEEEIV